MPMDRGALGIVVRRHAPLPHGVDDDRADDREDDDRHPGREPEDALDPVELLARGVRQPLEEDGHERRGNADHDADRDQLHDPLAHWLRAYFNAWRSWESNRLADAGEPPASVDSSTRRTSA